MTRACHVTIALLAVSAHIVNARLVHVSGNHLHLVAYNELPLA